MLLAMTILACLALPYAAAAPSLLFGRSWCNRRHLAQRAILRVLSLAAPHTTLPSTHTPQQRENCLTIEYLYSAGEGSTPRRPLAVVALRQTAPQRVYALTEPGFTAVHLLVTSFCTPSKRHRHHDDCNFSHSTSLGRHHHSLYLHALLCSPWRTRAPPLVLALRRAIDRSDVIATRAMRPARWSLRRKYQDQGRGLLLA